MRDIERRLAKLEQVREQEVTMVCLVSFVSPGVQRAVKGWKGDGYYIARKPGESEEALAVRAEVEAKLRSHSNANILLIEDREDLPSPARGSGSGKALPELAPEPVSVLALRTVPTLRPKVKAGTQALQAPTVQEIKSQFADIPHWMA
jgi:hypothetical protein